MPEKIEQHKKKIKAPQRFMTANSSGQHRRGESDIAKNDAVGDYDLHKHNRRKTVNTFRQTD